MKTIAFSLAICCTVTGWTYAAEEWPQYGRNCLHNPAVEGGAAPELTQPRWTVSPNFELTAASAPVVFDGTVYVYGLAYDWTSSYLAAYAAADRELLWQEPVDAAVQDSWSSPAVDPASRSVLIGSGRQVFAFDADRGTAKWVTDLKSDIFNASITVAEGRAFICDSTAIAGQAFGRPGTLFALNLGASDKELGEILWSAPLGVSSGCTPAYYFGGGDLRSLVIVADSDGWIRALHPETGEQEWAYQTPGAAGWKWTPGGTFWGGVSIEGGFVHACTYNFYGGEDNSYIYKLDAATGDFVWRTPSERSNSVPVVYGDLVLLCGGLHKYGLPKLEAFDKASGAKLWEFTGAGGRDHTPAVVNGTCYIGTVPDPGGFYYKTLHALDLSLMPEDDGFVISSYDGAGGSPAYAQGTIYSVGAEGLSAFGELLPEHSWPIEADANLDCIVNILDLIFVRNRVNSDPASGDNWQADVNNDGRINILDLVLVRNNLNSRCSKR